MKGTTKFLDAWIPETRVLIEHKSRGVNLDAPQAGHGGLTPYEQAVEYDNARPFDEKARWIVTCNFDEFRIYDRSKPLAPPLTLKLGNLPKEAEKFFVSRPAETLCNLMIVLIQQTKYLLDKMIAAQEADFKKHGGVRERMHAARTAARGEDWDKTIYSRLDGAATADELAARADEMRKAISRAVWSIKRRKNW